MNENIDLIRLIQSKFHNLSKGQKIIGQYIMSNYDKAAFMTAAKLGEKVGVSESTVVRFANAIGFSGYPQLQKQLQEIVKTKLTTVQRIEMTTDYTDEESVLKNVLKEDMENIRATLDEINFNTFENVVNLITEADNVYIIGSRTSTTLAEFLGFYLNLIIDKVHIVNYTIGDTFEQLFRINDKDLVIGMGFPRYSSKTISALKYCKSRGAKVVAITDSLLSPLAATADCTLVAKSNMESFVDSIVAPLSVLNALIISIGIKEKSNLAGSFGRLEEIWDKYSIFTSNDEK